MYELRCQLKYRIWHIKYYLFFFAILSEDRSKILYSYILKGGNKSIVLTGDRR